MRLRQALTVSPATGEAYTVPGHVYVLDTANIDRDPAVDRPDTLVTVLRAIVRTLPASFDPLADQIIWQGLRYYLDGPPIPRTRPDGRVHHYTLNLTTEDPTP